MFLNLLKYSSLLLIGWIFGAIIYNQDLKSLKNEFDSKDNSFLNHQTNLNNENFFSDDSDKHFLNQVSYRLNNISITDTTNLSIIDSLLAKISVEDSISNSIYKNQSGYNTFVNSFSSHLLTQTGFLNEEKLSIIKDIYTELEMSIRLNPENKIARHNYIILKSLHQSKDFNFQKAKELSDLVFNQLKRDLLSDTLRQKEFTSKTVLEGLEEKTNTIKSPNQKAQCISELSDTLNSLLDSSLLVEYQTKTVDSLRQYAKIDQGFVEDLEAGKTREEIINDFYSKDYQELFGNSSVDQIKKILKDKEFNQSLYEVLCKYLEEGCDQNQESKKDKESDEQEDKEGDQEQDQSQQESNDSESKGEGESQKEQGDKPNDKSGDGMEEYKNSKPDSQESQDQKSQEMSDKLDDYEQQRQQKAAQQQSQQGQSNNQDQQNKENSEGQQSQSSANQEKLDKYDITQEQAEEALKKIQEQNEKHYKNKQRQGNEQNNSEGKPSW